jgi:type I restriction enzyme, S subunit
MNPSLFFAHYDRIWNAPDAVSTLRQFILELAVRGKLVEQKHDEESAILLLARIKEKKSQLITNKESQKEKELPPLLSEESPFSIPANWEWVRIREVTSDRGQTSPDKEFTYIDVASIDNKAGRVANTRVLSAVSAPSRARKIVQKEDVIYSCVRPYLLNVAVIEEDIRPAPIVSTAFAVLNSFGLILPRYLWIVLRSPFMTQLVETKMRGQAYPAINDADFALLPFPLAPLAEQHRIVSRVDEVEYERHREQFLTTALKRLNEGLDTSNFQDQAHFYIEHFTHFSENPDQVQELRNALLQLAVTGRLLEQNSLDGNGNDLLNQITQNEHEPQEVLPGFEQREFTPNLPDNWAWSTVNQLAAPIDNAITDGPFGANLKTVDYVSTPGYRVIRLQNIGGGYFRDEHRSYISEGHFKRLSKHWVFPGDLVIAGLVDPLLRCCELPLDIGPAVVKADCYRFKTHPNLSGRFIMYYLNSPLCQSFAARYRHGMTLTRIGLANFRLLPVPIPPFTEQQRIATKIDELMILCDQLEVKLISSQDESGRVLEEVIKQVLGAKLYRTKEHKSRLSYPSAESLKPLEDNIEGQMSQTPDLPYSPSNPARTVSELVECVEALGGTAPPERLLNISGLGDNIELFFDLLRAARDAKILLVPTGDKQVIQRGNHEN